jgi:hypothetical protein
MCQPDANHASVVGTPNLDRVARCHRPIQNYVGSV